MSALCTCSTHSLESSVVHVMYDLSHLACPVVVMPCAKFEYVDVTQVSHTHGPQAFSRVSIGLANAFPAKLMRFVFLKHS